MLLSERNLQSETHAPHRESSPHSPQLEKDHKQQQKIQRSQKQNFLKGRNKCALTNEQMNKWNITHPLKGMKF